jgi:hypothetical protein
VAGGHVDKVFQACAVLRCLVLLAGLDSRSKAFLGRRDLYLQLLDHRSSPRARGLTLGRATTGRSWIRVVDMVRGQ